MRADTPHYFDDGTDISGILCDWFLYQINQLLVKTQTKAGNARVTKTSDTWYLYLFV